MSRHLLGIYIHNLQNRNGEKANKGRNPFEDFTFEDSERNLANIVKAYNPPYSNSQNVYNHIRENLENWIEEAIEIRNRYY